MLYKFNICEVFFILNITEFEIELEETRENQKKIRSTRKLEFPDFRFLVTGHQIQQSWNLELCKNQPEENLIFYKFPED